LKEIVSEEGEGNMSSFPQSGGKENNRGKKVLMNKKGGGVHQKSKSEPQRFV